MKLFLAVVFAVLLASTSCQQAITLENCLYNIGVFTADLSLVYRDRTNRNSVGKARADLQTLYDQCSVALPSSLGALKAESKTVNKKVTPKTKTFKKSVKLIGNKIIENKSA